MATCYISNVRFLASAKPNAKEVGCKTAFFGTIAPLCVDLKHLVGLTLHYFRLSKVQLTGMCPQINIRDNLIALNPGCYLPSRAWRKAGFHLRV
jgi:hypothetical protein